MALAAPASAGAATFTNATPVLIPNINGSPPMNNGAPYPSNIAVSGVTGTVVNVSISLNGVTGTVSAIDALAVGPGGQKVELMSDACGLQTGETLTFNDGAAGMLPAGTCSTGTFKPTSLGTVEGNYFTPAPVGPYGSTVTPLAGTPNGTWNLYTRNTGADDTDISIAGGWSIILDVAAPPGGGGPGGSGAAAGAGTDQCAGLTSTIRGTDGNDVLKGTRAADVIAAGLGNDKANGLKGNDVICGGPGKDKLKGGGGKDRIFGEDGKDKESGGPGKDKLNGAGAKDRLSGGGAKDVCKGGPAKDKATDSCEKQKSI